MKRFFSSILVLSAVVISTPGLAQAQIMTEIRSEQLGEPLSQGLPSWVHGYRVRIDPSGLLYLYSMQNNCEIFVVPQLWKQYRLLQKAGQPTPQVTNFGVDVTKLTTGQIPGSILTNDPNFDAQQVLQQNQGGDPNCPDNRCPPAPSPVPVSGVSNQYLLPMALFALALVILVFAFRRGKK